LRQFPPQKITTANRAFFCLNFSLHPLAFVLRRVSPPNQTVFYPVKHAQTR
jgi:hypothetical protein